MSPSVGGCDLDRLPDELREMADTAPVETAIDLRSAARHIDRAVHRELGDEP